MMEIRVEGKEIGLNEFSQKLIESTITTMVRSLKECENAKRIDIVIED